MRLPRQRFDRAFRGFTILEVVTTVAVTVILGASLLLGLLAARRSVALSRATNSARFILQRNLEKAFGVPYLSNIEPKPAVLQTTGLGGALFNDEGTGASATSVPILQDSSGTILLSGTLWRIVTAEPVPTSAALSDVSTMKMLRVTFRIDYHYLGRDYSQSLSSIRSQDDQ